MTDNETPVLENEETYAYNNFIPLSKGRDNVYNQVKDKY